MISIKRNGIIIVQNRRSITALKFSPTAKTTQITPGDFLLPERIQYIITSAESHQFRLLLLPLLRKIWQLLEQV